MLQAVPWLRRIRLVELLAVVAVLCLAVVVATAISRPAIRTGATAPDGSPYLSGFWPRERGAEGVFRWSHTDAALRLFGLEQRAPVLLQARMSAARKPGQPLV